MKQQKEKHYSFIGETFTRLMKNKLAVFGLIVLAGLVIVAIFADQIAPYAYDEMDLLNKFQSPGKGHIFGTDEFGRDIFSRVVYGSRISLRVGFIAVGISVVAGGLLGGIAGYYGGKMDNFIMRAMDVIMSIPATLLAISIAASLGPGLTNLMIATGIASIPTYARIVRASVLGIKGQEFVEAAKAVGTRDLTILRKHILPNCLAPIIVQATLGVAFAILTAAGLSFIGLGIEPPTPEWGAMLSNAREYVRDYSYMTLFPGLAIAVTIFSLNVLGDGLRDALDPKLRQ
jgi:ABC-type dipeptide/oligopeptide/nickel transport systems, permease components